MNYLLLFLLALIPTNFLGAMHTSLVPAGSPKMAPTLQGWQAEHVLEQRIFNQSVSALQTTELLRESKAECKKFSHLLQRVHKAASRNSQNKAPDLLKRAEEANKRIQRAQIALHKSLVQEETLLNTPKDEQPFTVESERNRCNQVDTLIESWQNVIQEGLLACKAGKKVLKEAANQANTSHQSYVD